MKNFGCTILLLCATCLFVNAQKNVYKLPLDSDSPAKGQTCCYMLPTTGFQVTLSVTKVREIKGYYADQAESLLGLTNVIEENRTYYKVGEISLKPVQLPDVNEAYLVELSPKQIKNNFVDKATKSKALTPHLDKETRCYTTSSTPIPDFFKNYSELSYSEQEDSYMETKIIDGVVTQVPANKTRKVSKSNIQKAQEAADAISKSRKDQYSLVSGEQETPYSEEALSRMLEELKQWEENYLSLFTGLTLEDEIIYTFYVIPDKSMSCPLFSFDPTKGVSFDNLTGNNIYRLELSPMLSTDAVSHKLNELQESKKDKGYRFRSAVPMHVKMSLQGKEVFDFGSFNMSQYGRIQTLPANSSTADLQRYGFVF